jgi:hypothetical protein
MAYAIPSPETGNFNDSTPSAPTGERNVKFQMDALSPTQISGHVPNVGGVDPRTTVTENIGLASQGKLVTLNNASAVAVSLDSTAGGGGGGSPTVDVLNWIAIPLPTGLRGTWLGPVFMRRTGWTPTGKSFG